VLPASAGELVAELAILLCEAAVSLGGGFQPAQRRGVRGPLPSANRRRGSATVGSAKAFNLSSDIGLGVEPGSGTRRRAGDGLERGDDVVEVAEDLLVHLGQALLAAGLGGRCTAGRRQYGASDTDATLTQPDSNYVEMPWVMPLAIH
jgi:hypothetical protein